MAAIPSCLRNLRISCEDLAEILPGASADLAATLYDLGARDAHDAWAHLSAQEQGELAELAEEEERRCENLFLAAIVEF